MHIWQQSVAIARARLTGLEELSIMFTSPQDWPARWANPNCSRNLKRRLLHGSKRKGAITLVFIGRVVMERFRLAIVNSLTSSDMSITKRLITKRLGRGAYSRQGEHFHSDHESECNPRVFHSSRILSVSRN